MKIPASIRQLHEDQRASCTRLQQIVDRRMNGIKAPRWHYESRIKSLTSFALKIETGRFEEPGALEDLFACTLVVANLREVRSAEALVSEHFRLRWRRPGADAKTHKSADSFLFDDLRLYVSLAEGSVQVPADLVEIVFEVQVKTFLQHAWAIATHDLTYKTDDVSWSRERIAYQVKAMLEHAEVSIEGADALADCSALAREDNRTAAARDGIALVKRHWTREELPSDVRRLAENVMALVNALGLGIGRVDDIMGICRSPRTNGHPANLSPYATVVQYLLRAETDKMMSLLEGRSSRFKVLIPAEVEMPAGVNREELPNAVIVGGRRA